MTINFSDAETKQELIGRLVGLCSATAFWDNMPPQYPSGAGVFESARAKEIADAAIARLAELDEKDGAA